VGRVTVGGQRRQKGDPVPKMPHTGKGLVSARPSEPLSDTGKSGACGPRPIRAARPQPGGRGARSRPSPLVLAVTTTSPLCSRVAGSSCALACLPTGTWAMGPQPGRSGPSLRSRPGLLAPDDGDLLGVARWCKPWHAAARGTTVTGLVAVEVSVSKESGCAPQDPNSRRRGTRCHPEPQGRRGRGSQPQPLRAPPRDPAAFALPPGDW
jgi:hypothetical protein